MAEWTDDEIEAAARAICKYRRINPESMFGWMLWIDDVKAALSAVKRTPDGYWIAPDEPTDEMLSVGDSQMPQFAHRGYPAGVDVAGDVYRAMRDVWRKVNG